MLVGLELVFDTSDCFYRFRRSIRYFVSAQFVLFYAFFFRIHKTLNQPRNFVPKLKYLLRKHFGVLC